MFKYINLNILNLKGQTVMTIGTIGWAMERTQTPRITITCLGPYTYMDNEYSLRVRVIEFKN